jgi:hypothetical protein
MREKEGNDTDETSNLTDRIEFDDRSLKLSEKGFVKDSGTGRTIRSKPAKTAENKLKVSFEEKGNV